MRWDKILAARCFIAFALIAAGYCAVTRSFAVTLSKSNPISALSVSSRDARVLAGAAQALLESAQTKKGQLVRAKQLAAAALARDATAVPAVTTLGLLAGLEGDDKRGAAWFDYSEKLSRRDFRTQLYLIEKSVADGAIGNALHHYDTALRTSEDNAPSVLFPVLRSAIADPPVRRQLAETLAARPLWAERFIAELAANGPDFVAAAQLFLEARARGAAIPQSSNAMVMSNLVSRGEIPVAWRFYLSSHPGADRRLLRNGDFGFRRAENTPFDWQVTTGDGVSASLGADDGDRALDYRLDPTITAPVVRQMTLLGPGKYRLSSVLSTSSQAIGSGPYWELTCFGGGAIGVLEMGGAPTQPKRFVLDIVVPTSCKAQVLTLIIRADDDIQGAAGRVNSVALSRIQ